jgi:DNA modification methylase
LKPFYSATHGSIFAVEALDFIKKMDDESVDLIFTSPPFDLITKKAYGNLNGEQYQNWLSSFCKEFRRILKPTGSLVLDFGGGWSKGSPTKNLYEYRFLLNAVDNFGFHLAQDCFWWDPTRLPTPAQWVNVTRERLKDAVNKLWWLSKTENPKANNAKVLKNYSKRMQSVLTDGTNVGIRSTGHIVSDNFTKDNGGAIPPNLIALSNSVHDKGYFSFCEENGLPIHPARFHPLLPEFFIRFLTEPGDLVLDPFAGSCVTGSVAEKLERSWICLELEQDYASGAIGRFMDINEANKKSQPATYHVDAPFFGNQKNNEPLVNKVQLPLFYDEK